MRKTIVFLLFLCFQLAAQAQTTYRYWFDTDDASMQEGVSNVDEWQMDIDVNELAENIHQLHLQVADKDGTWSTIHTHWFVKAPLTASHGMYWFDDNEKDMLRSDVMNGRFDIDVSKLTDGIHILNYQVRDTKDCPSAQYRTFFLKTPTPAKSKVHYWIDEDSEKLQTFAYNGNTHLLDLEGISDGFHTLHIQAEDASPSSPINKLFIKIPQTEGVETLLCMCSIDGELARQEEVSNKDGVLNWTFDVSDIPLGFHNIMVQVITKNGAGSSVYNGYFLRDFSSAEMASLKCIYSIDGGEHKSMAGNLGGGVFHFDLDVADIKDGLHNITYMLMGDGGVGTKSNTAFFWKTPIGGNGVMQYNYWLNDQTEKHEVKLAQRTNPFDLITLLPVDKMPIRSSCFDFKIENGSPILYAKNDIHFEFIDASGFVNMANAQYVDMSESLKVTDIAELKSTQTFTRPAENGIKWFKFEVETGDTIAFKASQATSLQVFAPSGKEIYSTMGDKSVVYGGAHTWEDGTYYVAVHDVTGSQQNFTLDYMHMDKYDVVSQDVRTVGNGGCSTITFHGNGFKDLYDVVLTPVLYSEFYLWDHNSRTQGVYGDTIHAIAIDHISDSEVAVTFDFSKIELPKMDHETMEGGAGSYRLLNIYCTAEFNFTEGEKSMHKYILVEKPKDIELATKVTYPSTFLRGTTTTYTVEITNKGNMTAYGVPVYTWIKSNKKDGITNVTIDGIVKESVIDRMFLTGDLTDDDIRDLKSHVDALDDDNVFMKMEALDEQGDTIFVRSNYFFINLGPKEKKNIRLTIQTNESEALAYFTVPDDWPSYSIQQSNETKKVRALYKSSSVKDKYCCISDKINCVATNLGAALDIASLFSSLFGPQVAAAINISDCLVSGAGAANKTLSYIVCDSDKPDFNPWKAAGDVFVSTSQAGLSCISGKLSKYGIKYLKSYNPELKSIGDMIGRLVVALDAESMGLDALHGNNPFKCLTELGKPKPGCPPTPPQGGSSTPVAPVDPNDIYGYIAASGTKFVGKDVVSMPYRIEFENDTTFATASAHTVVVKDTLDAKVFDLNSYQPTSIKIGDKDVQLKGDKTFVTTVDMRPAINAIAQVEGLYDEKKGIATWQFTSLDPMTMEPTDDIMQGFLPVNYDGSGIGEVAYNINRKAGLSDGVEIENKASIVFDNNDAIATPVWTNVIDAIPPVSEVSSLEQMNDSIVRVHFDGYDNCSDIWKYSLYVQYGEDSTWNEVAEMDSAHFDFRFYEDIDYGFCVLATDSAGNVEQKIIQREYMFLNGKTEKVDAITAPVDKKRIAVTKAYDLSGRVVQEEGYRGIIIKNRKKIQKR